MQVYLEVPEYVRCIAWATHQRHAVTMKCPERHSETKTTETHLPLPIAARRWLQQGLASCPLAETGSGQDGVGRQTRYSVAALLCHESITINGRRDQHADPNGAFGAHPVVLIAWRQEPAWVWSGGGPHKACWSNRGVSTKPACRAEPSPSMRPNAKVGLGAGKLRVGATASLWKSKFVDCKCKWRFTQSESALAVPLGKQTLCKTLTPTR